MLLMLFRSNVIEAIIELRLSDRTGIGGVARLARGVVAKGRAVAIERELAGKWTLDRMVSVEEHLRTWNPSR